MILQVISYDRICGTLVVMLMLVADIKCSIVVADNDKIINEGICILATVFMDDGNGVMWLSNTFARRGWANKEILLYAKVFGGT
jgi:hypothetical protein